MKRIFFFTFLLLAILNLNAQVEINHASPEQYKHLATDSAKIMAAFNNSSRIEISKQYKASSSKNLAIPDNKTLDFTKGGDLTNYTGTITAANTTKIINPDNHQIFSVTATIRGFDLDYAPAEWFGAVGDGSTDDTDEIQKTIEVFKRLDLVKGREYFIDDDAYSAIIIDANNVYIDGHGAIMINNSPDDANLTMFRVYAGSDSLTIKNIEFKYTHTITEFTYARKGIVIGTDAAIDTYNTTIENCTFYRCQLQMKSTFNPKVTNCRFIECNSQPLSLNSGKHGLFDQIMFENVQNVAAIGSLSGCMVVDSRSNDIYSNFTFTNIATIGKFQSDEDSCINHLLTNWNIYLIDTVTAVPSIMYFDEVAYVCENIQLNNFEIHAPTESTISVGFRINAGVSNVSFNHIDFYNSADLTLFQIIGAENITLNDINSADCDRFVQDANSPSSNLTIRNSTVMASGDNTIELGQASSNVKIINNTLSNSNSFECIYISGDLDGYSITGNTFLDGNRAIYTRSSGTGIISRNIIDGTTYGIWLRDANGRFLVNYNIIKNITYGIYATEGKAEINNNHVYDTPIYSIWVTGADSSIVRDNWVEATIVNTSNGTIIHDNKSWGETPYQENYNILADGLTVEGSFLMKQVTYSTNMNTDVAGTEGEIAYCTTNNTFYGCTVTGGAGSATWVALH